MSKWVRTLDIEDSWNKAKNNEITLFKLAEEAAFKLKAFNANDYELEEIIEELENFSKMESYFDDLEEAQAEFNYTWNDLYDWADASLDVDWNGRKRCWIKTF